MKLFIAGLSPEVNIIAPYTLFIPFLHQTSSFGFNRHHFESSIIFIANFLILLNSRCSLTISSNI